MHRATLMKATGCIGYGSNPKIPILTTSLKTLNSKGVMLSIEAESTHRLTGLNPKPAQNLALILHAL